MNILQAACLCLGPPWPGPSAKSHTSLKFNPLPEYLKCPTIGSPEILRLILLPPLQGSTHSSSWASLQFHSPYRPLLRVPPQKKLSVPLLNQQSQDCLPGYLAPLSRISPQEIAELYSSGSAFHPQTALSNGVFLCNRPPTEIPRLLRGAQ